jgi:hypothetical protein
MAMAMAMDGGAPDHTVFVPYLAPFCPFCPFCPFQLLTRRDPTDQTRPPSNEQDGQPASTSREWLLSLRAMPGRSAPSPRLPSHASMPRPARQRPSANPSSVAFSPRRSSLVCELVQRVGNSVWLGSVHGSRPTFPTPCLLSPRCPMLLTVVSRVLQRPTSRP